MKILITGGAGFIGSHLAEKFLKLKNEVTVIDDLSTGNLNNIQNMADNKKFKFVIDSILNRAIMDELIGRSDMVLHLAAAVGVKYIIDNPLLSLETNITGTETVLSLANKYKKKVFLASTSEIYGKNDKESLAEEDDRILGSTHISRWGYSSSKAIDEFLAMAYYREKKLPIIIGRFFNTVGPRQSEKYGMVIPRFIKQALLGHPITIFGKGEQKRCFTYIDDTIDAVVNLVNCDKAYGEVFNIGNTEETSISNLAKRVKRITSSNSEIVYVPYEKAYEKGFEDMKRRRPDISKINKYVGFIPQYGLDEILERTKKYFET